MASSLFKNFIENCFLLAFYKMVMLLLAQVIKSKLPKLSGNYICQKGCQVWKELQFFRQMFINFYVKNQQNLHIIDNFIGILY